MGVLLAVILAFIRTDIMQAVGSGQAQNEQLMMNWSVSAEFLYYLLFFRGLPFYLLILITIKTGSRLFFYLYFIYGGFAYGVQAVLLTMYYQAAGIPIFLFQICPQVFCYIPALLVGYRLTLMSDGQQSKGRMAVLAVLIWTVGLIMECYVNPYVIKFCMKAIL